MKNIFTVSLLILFAMICSCQKQDSAAEQELAQRKTELDARENALDERVNALDEKVNALDEKVKALFEKEQATLNARTTSAGVQGQTPDPAQVQAERERAQQLVTEMRAMIPDHSKMKAESDTARRRALEELQRQRQPKQKMSGGAVFPAPEAASPTPSPSVEAASPTSTPTPQ
jgi:chaperonin cofactor prefoldin